MPIHSYQHRGAHVYRLLDAIRQLSEVRAARQERFGYDETVDEKWMMMREPSSLGMSEKGVVASHPTSPPRFPSLDHDGPLWIARRNEGLLEASVGESDPQRLKRRPVGWVGKSCR